jgi:hypothetical protein
MDFTWVTTDDANAIQNSIVDAKGDLISATANDTPARLAVGANGETLVADSSTSTGLRWQTPIQQNPVLNSAMQVWQRGTSVSVAASTATTYTADRWLAYTAANQATTVSRQATNDSTNLPFIQYCARVQRNSGQTGTSENYFSYGFETINSLPYAGKTVTVSFYARAGANYSAASGAFGVGLNTATGTDQPVTSYNTGVLSPISGSYNLTTTWQRFTATGTLSSTLNEMGIFFRYTWAGTAGANDYFEVTGVQLDVGSVALPFRTYAATIQGELSACMRYYWRSSSNTGTDYAWFATGMSKTTTTAGIWLPNPVPMRTGATSLDFANLMISDLVNYNLAVSAVTLSNSIPLGSELLITNAATATALRPAVLRANNSPSAYIGCSAEL